MLDLRSETAARGPPLDVIVATWATGGNLPPLLGVAALLRAGGHRVRVLTSTATSADARGAGFETLRYRRARSRT